MTNKLTETQKIWLALVGRCYVARAAAFGGNALADANPANPATSRAMRDLWCGAAKDAHDFVSFALAYVDAGYLPALRAERRKQPRKVKVKR